MDKIVFITPHDAKFAFQLTGAEQHVTDDRDFMKTLKDTTNSPDTGLVIVDERLLSASNEEKVSEIERSWKGILIVLPSPERPEAEIEDYATRLIRKAIGYHLRLNI